MYHRRKLTIFAKLFATLCCANAIHASSNDESEDSINPHMMLRTINSQKVTSSTPVPVYDESFAKAMLFLCAGAYSRYDWSKKLCIERSALSYGGAWHLVTSITKPCDFYTNHCHCYIVASDTKQELVVVFRGTSTKKQLFAQMWIVILKHMRDLHNMTNINGYFSKALSVLWRSGIEEYLKDPKYKDYKVTFTGHSLGGALASLASAQTVLDGLRKSDNIKLYTFGQPCVGSYDYAQWHTMHISHSFRVVNANDLVPHLPGCAKFEEGREDISQSLSERSYAWRAIHMGRDLLSTFFGPNADESKSKEGPETHQEQKTNPLKKPKMTNYPSKWDIAGKKSRISNKWPSSNSGIKGSPGLGQIRSHHKRDIPSEENGSNEKNPNHDSESQLKSESNFYKLTNSANAEEQEMKKLIEAISSGDKPSDCKGSSCPISKSGPEETRREEGKNTQGYHHGIEVWYPNGMEDNAKKIICDQKTGYDECSKAVKFTFNWKKMAEYILNHRNYYGMLVSGYGHNGCYNRGLVEFLKLEQKSSEESTEDFGKLIPHSPKRMPSKPLLLTRHQLESNNDGFAAVKNKNPS